MMNYMCARRTAQTATAEETDEQTDAQGRLSPVGSAKLFISKKDIRLRKYSLLTNRLPVTIDLFNGKSKAH